jgi:excisionase family DNA binding protein
MADITTTASNSPRFPEAIAGRQRSKPRDLVALLGANPALAKVVSDLVQDAAKKPPPLAVPPLEAARLLSCGLSHVYTLMGNNELRAFSSGRARRVTMDSIRAYMARQLAKADAKASDPAEPAPARRRPGRSRAQGRK